MSPQPKKYRDRLASAAYAFKYSADGSVAFLAEVDAIMLEISEREDVRTKRLRALVTELREKAEIEGNDCGPELAYCAFEIEQILERP